MFFHFKTAAAVLFAASMPLHLAANADGLASEPLSAKEVRKAEAQAKTAADHLRLAAWYQSEARELQTRLKEQEDLANDLGRRPDMVMRTKIPNSYWNAQAWARIYREKLERATKLAANHERIAKSLDASVTSTQ